jgi:hypothetical protein
VDSGQLSKFPGSHSKDKSHHISLFLTPEFFQIFVGTHNILIYFIIFKSYPLIHNLLNPIINNDENPTDLIIFDSTFLTQTISHPYGGVSHRTRLTIPKYTLIF